MKLQNPRYRVSCEWIGVDGQWANERMVINSFNYYASALKEVARQNARADRRNVLIELCGTAYIPVDVAQDPQILADAEWHPHPAPPSTEPLYVAVVSDGEHDLRIWGPYTAVQMGNFPAANDVMWVKLKPDSAFSG